MKHVYTFLWVTLVTTACGQGQTTERSVGGSCEGCEAIYEYGDMKLTASATLPDFSEAGPKLKISGTIYQKDGKTPARDVILYIYHTDQKGIYPQGPNAGKHHGYIRGWIKTGADGKYSFYTLLPASYPNSDNPKHIHPIIKEPGLQAYWIDEFLFDDDPLLTEKQKSHIENRGGSGILKLSKDKNGMLIGHRDIILGKNVPGY
ncbi:MAG TPA: intradiol ring-cleavage dioxygenase [Ohtaekwangia sp.]